MNEQIRKRIEETPAALEPLIDVAASPVVAALPKADLHLHQEVFPRLERIVARQQGREPFAWHTWARHVMDTVAAGPGRLQAIYRPDQTLGVDRTLDNDPELFITRVADILAEAATDGAIYVEVRFGADRLTALPDFMDLFREAEERVQAHHPRLRAEAIGYVEVWDDAERLGAEEVKLNACLRAARDGLGGIDLLVRPYDATEDPELWGTAYRWAERAASAGLGLTVHVGEFATTSIAAALRTPSLRRIGHGTRVADDPQLLDDLARSGRPSSARSPAMLWWAVPPLTKTTLCDASCGRGSPSRSPPIYLCMYTRPLDGSTRSLRFWASRPTSCSHSLGTRSQLPLPPPRGGRRC